MESKTSRKRYNAEYKAGCVERAQRVGNIAAAARELGLGYGLLVTWVRRSERSSPSTSNPASMKSEGLEIQRLKRELAIAREERDILKKATAYFSQKELKRGTPL